MTRRELERHSVNSMILSLSHYRHWVHRQELELRICEELFPDRFTVLPSKSYGETDVDKLLG